MNLATTPGRLDSQAYQPEPESYDESLRQGESGHVDPEHEKDFNKAYSKLVKKFYYQQEQGANILIPEEDLMRVEEEQHYSNQPSRGFDPNEVKRRIEDQQRKREERLELLRKEKEQKELEGCTFAPQMVKKAKQAPSQPESSVGTTGEQKRDLNKFLDD